MTQQTVQEQACLFDVTLPPKVSDKWPEQIKRPTMDIKFSTNWNNKLHLHFFTTIRIDSDKYQVGKAYKILSLIKKSEHKLFEGSQYVVKEGEHWYQYLFRGVIVAKKTLLLHNLPEITAYLDTGYNLVDTIALFKKMYPKIDFSKQKIAVLLIENIEFNNV